MEWSIKEQTDMSTMTVHTLDPEDRYGPEATDSLWIGVRACHRVYPIDYYLCSSIDSFNLCRALAAGKFHR